MGEGLLQWEKIALVGEGLLRWEKIAPVGEGCSGRCCAVPGQQRSPCSPLVPRAAAAAFVPVAVGQTRGNIVVLLEGKAG